MARPVWKGYLRLSLVTCEVTLHPATSEAEHVRFHMLAPRTENRVRQQLVDAETGDPVERKDVLHGYEVAKGQHVVVTDQELDRLRIESSHVIEIERFVAARDLDPLFLDKPYYVVPEGKVGAQAFAVIRAAMQRQGRIALGRVVLAQREHAVAIQPHGDGLSLTTLRAADEVRAAEGLFAAVKAATIDAGMVKLAESLIADKAGAFDTSAFHDRYQEALRDLVEAKRKGTRFKAPTLARPSNVVNLMEALKRSVAQSSPPKAAAKRTPRARKAPAKRRKAS